jgi:hypothetical protein
MHAFKGVITKSWVTGVSRVATEVNTLDEYSFMLAYGTQSGGLSNEGIPPKTAAGADQAAGTTGSAFLISSGKKDQGMLEINRVK